MPMPEQSAVCQSFEGNATALAYSIALHFKGHQCTLRSMYIGHESCCSLLSSGRETSVISACLNDSSNRVLLILILIGDGHCMCLQLHLTKHQWSN